VNAAAVHGDRGLAALALYEAVADGNDANWRAVVDHTDVAELLTGLVGCVHVLVQSLAAQSGSTHGDVRDALRALLLTLGDET
jgi:hypothetical protein